VCDRTQQLARQYSDESWGLGRWFAQDLTKQCWDDKMGQWGIRQRRQNRQQGPMIGLDNEQSMTRRNTLLAQMTACICSGSVQKG
jgi:hypothetical protein